MEVCKTQESAKIKDKLDAYMTVKKQFEKSINKLETCPVIMSKRTSEISKLEETVRSQFKNLQELHTRRESIENNAIRGSDPKIKVPMLDLQKVTPTFIDSETIDFKLHSSKRE